MIKVRNVLISILCVLGAAIFAIVVHVLMPSPGAAIKIEDFNSVLVKMFGFPIVASAYFVFLYLHILLVFCFIGKKSCMNHIEIGLRYGIAFALIYIVGMQEVAVEASPFLKWGGDFVLFQFFMGLGDAIPVFVLCILIANLILPTKKQKLINISIFNRHNVVSVVIISFTFFIQRIIGYTIGYIDSDIEKFTVPVIAWTAIFGITLGIAFILISPIYIYENTTYKYIHILILTIGINWIIFNSFIGMIMAGTIGQMLLRSGVDILVLFLANIFHNKFFKNNE